MPVNESEFIKRWKEGVSNGSQKYIDGIKSCQVNPAEEAIKAKEKARRKYNEAMDSGKWEAGLRSSSREFWQSQATGEGAAKYASSTKKGEAKLRRVAAELVANYQKASELAKSMPNVTDQDAENRMTANLRFMREFGKRRANR